MRDFHSVDDERRPAADRVRRCHKHFYRIEAPSRPVMFKMNTNDSMCMYDCVTFNGE